MRKLFKKVFLSSCPRDLGVHLKKKTLAPSVFAFFQQFTYGVVSEWFFAEILRKVAKIRLIASGKGAEILWKFSRHSRKHFCNDPFPNDPISQKNPCAHKNKIGTPPPPPKKNPKQKERIFPGVHKIDAPISGPRIADKLV